jgi:heat shock protein HtpX
MSTRIRTWVLIAGLSALLVAIGAVIGGTRGIIGFAVIAALFNFVMFWFSDRIALKMSKATPIPEGEQPQLREDIVELCGKAGIPVPSLHLIPNEQPNAFATGRNPSRSAVAVTEGLLRNMPREQVKGVLAHELSHIKNRDVLVTTISAMIAASISAIANILQFSFLFGGMGDDDESPLAMVGAIATIILAPIAAMLLQLGVSRQREYLADATAARLLGEGRPLAEALRTLQRGVEAVPMQVNPATASLYIASPLRARGMSALFSTHPPMERRIEKLVAYDAAHGIHYAV